MIELLSPTYKRPGSDGQREYLRKRDLVLLCSAHLVEIDLLRGGDRLPMARDLPPADYYVIVSRASRRPLAQVWPVGLREALPTIPVPLSDPDEIAVNLQVVLQTVHTRAGYANTLDYSAALRPALSPEDADWLRAIS